MAILPHFNFCSVFPALMHLSLLQSTLLSSHARLPTSSAGVMLTGVSGRLEPGTTAPKWGLREIKSLRGSQARRLSELSHLLMALLWPPNYAAPVAFSHCLAGWKILRAAPPCAIPYSNSPQPAGDWASCS